MDPVPLAAGKLPHFLLLVGAAEIEGTDIGAALRLAVAEQYFFLALADFLPNRLVVGQRVARLIDIAERHRVADPEFARIRFLGPGDHAEQGRLAGAVRPDHPDDSPRRNGEIEILDQQDIAESLAQLRGSDDKVAEARSGGDDDLRVAGTAIATFRQQLFIGRDARLRLRLACPRTGGDPFLFVGERPQPRLVDPFLVL